jgi:hypothetical protein
MTRQTHAVAGDLSDRDAFLERLRTQVRARYPGVTVDADTERFALRLTGARLTASLPVTPLHNACLRAPRRTSALIADFVRTVDRQLEASDVPAVVPSHLLWCVRSVASLQGIQRAGELVTREISPDLVGFVAERLPGPAMRGVPLVDLESAGHDEAGVRALADRQTAKHFASVPQRIRSADRIPADGWRLGSDQLFQGSALLVPDVLAAFADRAGGEVLLAVPDRSVILALPAALPGADRFGMRVTRAYREAMNPCSREVLSTDGTELRALSASRRRRRAELLPWVRD